MGWEGEHMVNQAIMVGILVGAFTVGLVQDLKLIRLGHPKIGVPFIVLHIGVTIWGIVAVLNE